MQQFGKVASIGVVNDGDGHLLRSRRDLGPNAEDVRAARDETRDLLLNDRGGRERRDCVSGLIATGHDGAVRGHRTESNPL